MNNINNNDNTLNDDNIVDCVLNKTTGEFLIPEKVFKGAKTGKDFALFISDCRTKILTGVNGEHLFTYYVNEKKFENVETKKIKDLNLDSYYIKLLFK